MKLECGCETHPGKFEGESAATVILWDWSMESSQDDECGDVDTSGWFALFRGPLDGADVDRTYCIDHGFCTTHIDEAIAQLQAMTGAILSQSSQGFVSSTVYTDAQQLNTAWGKVYEIHASDEDEIEECSECGHEHFNVSRSEYDPCTTWFDEPCTCPYAQGT